MITQFTDYTQHVLEIICVKINTHACADPDKFSGRAGGGGHWRDTSMFARGSEANVNL